MSEIAFALKQIVSAMVLPPVGPAVLIGVGLLMLNRRRKLGLFFAWVGVLIVGVLSTPLVSGQLLGSLQDSSAITDPAATRAEAIVILAGGLRRQAVEYRGDTLNALTLERLRYGAWLAKRTGLPILVTGGFRYDEGPSEADVMRDILKAEYNRETRWVEPKSRDTAENAAYSAQLLRAENIRHVLLVTHAWHMRRAMAEFIASGLDPIPAPTVFVRDNRDLEWRSFLPTPKGYHDSAFALHEWLGILWAKVRGV